MSEMIKINDRVVVSDPETGASSVYIIREIDRKGNIYISTDSDPTILSLIYLDSVTKQYQVLNAKIQYVIEFYASEPPFAPCHGKSSCVNTCFASINDRVVIDKSKIIADLTRRLINLKSYDLIVFDFDCTVSKLHTCSNNITLTDALAPNAITRTIGDEDAQNFENFVNDLKLIGKNVAIASYGTKSIILTLLSRIFGTDDQFDSANVITPIDVATIYGVKWKECHDPPPNRNFNKNSMLNILSNRYNIKPARIFLVDDTKENILNAQAGYAGKIVPRCQGFGRVIETLLD